MKYIILDIREPAEFAHGHIDSAVNIPPSILMSSDNNLAHIPKDANIIVYCVTGSRSRIAQRILEQQGFTNVINGINKAQVKARFGL